MGQKPGAEEGITEGGQCVGPDDEGSSYEGNDPGEPKNPACGNHTVETQFGEECDDGNTVSGDGCNQFCRNEDTGADEMCRDPDAITFELPPPPASKPVSAPLMGNLPLPLIGPSLAVSKIPLSSSSPSESQTKCPEGTYPKKPLEEPPPLGPGYEEAPQSPGYPGPGIGGTLKEFPPSKKPPCPTGYSDTSAATSHQSQSGNDSGSGGASASASGNETLGINIGGKQYDISRCIPNEFCASFDDFRNWIFGEEWKGDPEVTEVAMAIEAMICAKVTKANRPLSPYGKDEGCIDCLISGTADVLDKVLERGITPQENNMSAFAISTHWGPNFSFDLNTSIKSKLRVPYVEAKSFVNSVMDSMMDAIKGAESADKNIPAEVLTARQQAEKEKAQQQQYLDTLEGYGKSADAASDDAINRQIIPLIKQMRDSFIRLNAKWNALAGSMELDKLKACDLSK